LELQNHAFFVSAVDGDDWPASYPGLNSAEERMPPTLLIEDALGLRSGMDGEKTGGFR